MSMEIKDALEEAKLYTAKENPIFAKEDNGKLNIFDSTSQTVASVVDGLITILKTSNSKDFQFLAVKQGTDIIARGIARGEERAKESVAQLLSSLEGEIEKIKKIFLILNYDKQPVTLDEIAVIKEEITKVMGNQQGYSFVLGQDFSQGDNLSITLLVL